MENIIDATNPDRSQLLLARELVSQNRLAEAADVFSALVLKNTDLFEPYFELGEIAADQNDVETAVTLIELCLSKTPQFLPAQRRLASLYGHQNRFDEAFAAISPVLRSPSVTVEDYNLVRELLGKCPALPHVTWARLLTDIKTPAPEQQSTVREAEHQRQQLARLSDRISALVVSVRHHLSLLDAAPDTGSVSTACESIHTLLDNFCRDGASAGDLSGGSQNFCILPWKHLNLKTDGTVQLCCQGPQIKDAQGRPLTVYDHSIMEIWNSPHMQNVRRAMLSGTRQEGCDYCWRVEDGGGVSRRMEMNSAVANLEATVRQLRKKAGRDSFCCTAPPSDYQLDMGSACNLKCRTCTSKFSSRIAADPLHQKWEEGNSNDWRIYNVGETKIDRGNKLPWYDDGNFLFGDLLSHPEQISDLHIIGGEPLVVRQFAPIIQHLRDQGTPASTTIAFTTNGTRFDPSLTEAMARFRNISISISLDGFGDQFEYIRYPGRWNDFIESVDKYRNMPNVCLSAIPTFHIYNALNYSEILRYCDDRSIRVIFNPLRAPAFLASSVLPPTAKQVVIARLRDYAQKTRFDKQRDLAEMLIHELDAPFDADLLRKFMLFTNDLDASRKMRFRDIFGEMITLMAQDGFEWTNETLHAATPP